LIVSLQQGSCGDEAQIPEARIWGAGMACLQFGRKPTIPGGHLLSRTGVQFGRNPVVPGGHLLSRIGVQFGRKPVIPGGHLLSRIGVQFGSTPTVPAGHLLSRIGLQFGRNPTVPGGHLLSRIGGQNFIVQTQMPFEQWQSLQSSFFVAPSTHVALNTPVTGSG